MLSSSKTEALPGAIDCRIFTLALATFMAKTAWCFVRIIALANGVRRQGGEQFAVLNAFERKQRIGKRTHTARRAARRR